MINVGTFNYVDPGAVEAIIQRSRNDAEYPYLLAVRLKSGYELQILYRSANAMQKEADRVSIAVDRWKLENRLTQGAVRMIVEHEVDKLRPYMRRIEKMVREGGAGNGTEGQ